MWYWIYSLMSLWYNLSLYFYIILYCYKIFTMAISFKLWSSPRYLFIRNQFVLRPIGLQWHNVAYGQLKLEMTHELFLHVPMKCIFVFLLVYTWTITSYWVINWCQTRINLLGYEQIGRLWGSNLFITLVASKPCWFIAVT